MQNFSSCVRDYYGLLVPAGNKEPLLVIRSAGRLATATIILSYGHHASLAFRRLRSVRGVPCLYLINMLWLILLLGRLMSLVPRKDTQQYTVGGPCWRRSPPPPVSRRFVVRNNWVIMSSLISAARCRGSSRVSGALSSCARVLCAKGSRFIVAFQYVKVLSLLRCIVWWSGPGLTLMNGCYVLCTVYNCTPACTTTLCVITVDD